MRMITTVLSAALVILTACTPPTKEELAFKNLKERFEVLASTKDTQWYCVNLNNWKSLNDLRDEYRNGQYRQEGFSQQLNRTIKVAAQNTTRTAYEKMKKGELLRCALGKDTMQMFDTLRTLMKEHGPLEGAETFDMRIVRAACLREVQPEIQVVLKEVQANPKNGEALVHLSNFLDNLKESWSFTTEELGIPKSISDELP